MQRFGLIACSLSLTVAAAQPWPAVLSTLNQPNVPPPSDYSAAIEEDLSARYQREIRALRPAQRPTTPAQREEENRRYQLAIQRLNADFRVRTADLGKSASAKDFLSIASRVQKNVTHHPVAGLAATRALLRSSEIGYCFGRALLAHWELLRAGVPQSEIVKVFAMGDLNLEGQFWKFHVATGVRDRGHGLLMIDPLQSKVLPIEEWVVRVQDYDVKRPFSRIRFYLTDPRKFLPSGGMYGLNELNDPILHAYFARLGKSLN